jgi:Leucine-rich repeat (LRR) protein
MRILRRSCWRLGPSNSIAKNLAGNYFKIDANNDGEIQVNEALQVSQLNVYSSNILSLIGIQNFTNLYVLNCQNNQITSLDLSGLINLGDLVCSNNFMTSLTVSDLASLYSINCNANRLTSLNLTGSTFVNTLNCTDNQLTNLNVNGLTSLQTLECGTNRLTILDVSTNSILQTLNCSSNLFTSLNMIGANYLISLLCANNFLVNINVSTNRALTHLDCYNNRLANLNLSLNTSLYYLYCSNNLLTDLDLSANTALNELYCADNQITKLLIKNGKNESILYFQNNPTLRYLCVDESQLSNVQANIINLGYGATCQVNSYCSFKPGGVFYTVQGDNKLDTNNNGCDALDIPFPNIKLNIDNGTTSGSIVSNTTGNYAAFVKAGIHTITPILQNPSYFTVSPTATTITFPATASPATRNFCITPNGVHNDLEIAILPITRARPGFDATYKIVYKNKGNQTMSGNITVQFPDNTTDFVSATPVVNTQNVGNLIWNYANLLPFESRSITFTLNLNTPMETPPLNAGSLIGFSGTITPIIGDEYVNDNSFALRQLVVNSFDPNDKTCLEGNTIEPAKVGDFVHYMIRFQNDGTAAAQNIVVKDMIDMAKFDIATLIPVDGSHSFTTKISETNKVEFIFENINLPFATGTNQGFVAFKIKTKSTLVLGNTFSNSANIYFDYNFPIITNNYTTTIAALATQDFEFSKYFSLYPNPAKDILNIEVKNDIEISSISVYNMLGQLVLVNTSSEKTIDVSALKTGNYFVKISTDKGTANSRFVKE